MMDDVRKLTAWGMDDGVHDALPLKPITTPEQQIDLLKGKGVTFERCAEERALEILSNAETYLHLSAYRVLFQRHEDGPDAGKFVSLDFGNLLDVSSLDDVLRETFRLMAKDVERAVRAWLVSDAAKRGEDGYGIVADFVSSLPRGFREGLRRDLVSRSQADEYAGSLIDHYRDAMPVWVLLEVVPFGTLLAFYLFCVERWDEAERREIHYALKDVKAVRNCASHAGCLCNGFVPERETRHATSGVVLEWLNAHGIRNSKGRRARLRNRRTQQLVTTVALHDMLTGEHASPAALDAVAGLRPLMDDAIARYGTQNPLVSHLAFLARVLDVARG